VTFRCDERRGFVAQSGRNGHNTDVTLNARPISFVTKFLTIARQQRFEESVRRNVVKAVD